MVPNFDHFMRPFLEHLADGKDHTLTDCVAYMQKYFNLSQDDITETIPSGTETKIHNRTNWAMTYLKKAGLTDSNKRGIYHITEKGRELVNTGNLPDVISTKYLKDISQDFKIFSEGNSTHSDHDKTPQQVAVPSGNLDSETPEDRMQHAFDEINSQLADELLQKVLETNPKYFEHIVVELLERMGYGDGTITQYVSDEGIDGIINEDKLGLDKIYIQAKRWARGETVGSPAIREFIGAVSSHGGSKGVFITTSSFAKKASEVKDPHVKLILIDGEHLAKLMIQYNLGVSVKKTYEVKRIDNDYFEIE